MKARVAIVSGSGLDLSALLDRVTQTQPFAAFPTLGAGHVQGHRYQFVFGEADGVPVVVQEGRLHPYEGLPFKRVTAAADLFAAWGVKAALFTNAVGSLLPALEVGALVAAASVHTWPYRPYALQQSMTPDFVLPGCDAQGAYWWMHGPCYETRAEIAALRNRGGATVGMSSAPELQAVQARGMRGGIVSCVTNSCIHDESLSHSQVLAVARASSARLQALLKQQIHFLAG